MSIKVGVTSLGCAKNLVDSEIMLGYLRSGGLDICADLDQADVIIVNTCAFISEAEKEAEDTIGELLDLKKRGAISRVLVAGCLPARRGAALRGKLSGVDYFVSPSEIPSVARIVRSLAAPRSRPVRRPGGRSGDKRGWFLYDHLSPRVGLTPPHYAYVKVSEGCSNHCSYCLIPSIKGPHRSRAVDSIVEEAESLAGRGVKEINLISQDTTAYGSDRSGGGNLEDLLKNLAKIDGISWIRVLYGHPGRYTSGLLEFMAGEPKICNYVDFPLQHISDAMLAAMNRRMTKRQAVERLSALRRLIPNVTVRTTFMVGHPGEGEGDFRELLDFVEESRFEHLGAFIYSRERGTPSAGAPRQVPHKTKRARFHRLMALQQEIVRQANLESLGNTVRVLVDEKLSEGTFSLRGRTEGDAPEVDGAVYAAGGKAEPGDFIRVRITGAMEYDLAGEMANEPS